MRRVSGLAGIVLISVLLSGCFFTKVVSAPMRVVGGVASIVPVVGEKMHDSIDSAADAVDKAPL
ncbi:DUF6726 family protein [Magnetofaba australis]|nr:DUF6726 family protein [Magnetofaba australis]